MKVRLSKDTDGYITGWGSDYTPDDFVDLTEEQLASIVLGATKLTDGKLVIDTAKQKALTDAETQETTQPDLTAKVADLESQLQEAQQAIMELADISLGGDTDATSTTTTTSAG